MALALAMDVLLADERVDADLIAVFVALARRTDEHGRCRPGQGTIGGQLGRSRPWVNARVARLVDLGHVSKDRQYLKKGGETSCAYYLPALDIEAASPPVITVTPPCQPADTPCHQRDTNHDSHESEESSLSATSPPVLLHSAWQPDAADLAWAAGARPDIGDIPGFTKKFIAKVNSAGGCHGDPSTRWRQWLVDERVPMCRSGKGARQVPPPGVAAGRAAAKSSVADHNAAVSQQALDILDGLQVPTAIEIVVERDHGE